VSWRGSYNKTVNQQCPLSSKVFPILCEASLPSNESTAHYPTGPCTTIAIVGAHDVITLAVLGSGYVSSCIVCLTSDIIQTDLGEFSLNMEKIRGP